MAEAPNADISRLPACFSKLTVVTKKVNLPQDTEQQSVPMLYRMQYFNHTEDIFFVCLLKRRGPANDHQKRLNFLSEVGKFLPKENFRNYFLSLTCSSQCFRHGVL